VVPSSCGARVPVGDASRMADEVEKLLDDASLYAACSANARLNAATYDWARICDTCDDLYRVAS
jgi:glycosyltransferase involved in cell wall biosynthesis